MPRGAAVEGDDGWSPSPAMEKAMAVTKAKVG